MHQQMRLDFQISTLELLGWCHEVERWLTGPTSNGHRAGLTLRKVIHTLYRCWQRIELKVSERNSAVKGRNLVAMHIPIDVGSNFTHTSSSEHPSQHLSTKIVMIAEKRACNTDSTQESHTLPISSILQTATANIQNRILHHIHHHQ
jgi:hypothetical protein